MGCRVQDSGFRVQGSGFRVQGSWSRVQGPGFMVQGSGSRGQVPGFSVYGIGLVVGVDGGAARSWGPQGYLAHKKPHLPRTLQKHMPRAMWWSYGGCCFS